MAALSGVCQVPTAKPGKRGGVPSPGVPFSVTNKAGAHFLLSLAAGSAAEGGDAGETYCAPRFTLLLLHIFTATPQGSRGVVDGAFLYRETEVQEGL